MISSWFMACLLCTQPPDNQNRIWLARMVVYEGGWTNENEHLALLHTINRRWRKVSTAPLYTYVQAYSTGLAPPWPSNGRRAWVRQLEWSDKRPKAFPRRLSWTKHARWWAQVRALVGRFLAGQTRDPCRGRSIHWAAPSIQRKDLIRVNCGHTKNIYYR